MKPLRGLDDHAPGIISLWRPGPSSIERSAAPFHDWNERIATECFNFGPTLLAWLERHAPDIYRHILEADARSAIDRGHGNAIAQAYNHAILPLCNDRDLRTQIRWGWPISATASAARPKACGCPRRRACARRAESGARRGERLLVGRRAAAIDE
jgi:alpha-amylase/alpha-mannosidase (GH57 family)